MNLIIPPIDLGLLSLEFSVVILLVFFVALDLSLPPSKKHWIGRFSFVGILFLLWLFWNQCELRGETFQGMYVLDSLAWFFKGFFLLTLFFILVMTQEFIRVLERGKSEFYLLLWSALLGMLLVASSADFLLLFIALELLTISLYVMTAYLRTEKSSIEAGMKYLILGSLASGLFLYGISFLYGATLSTRFITIQQYLATHPATPNLIFGFVLVFAAVGFKIASVPFHLWVPDVYQGAPTPVTAFLSVGSKATGFLILLRLLFGVFAPIREHWVLAVAMISAFTMLYGNLAAIPQQNIKRLLGYSSIGHAGYLLMGATTADSLGAGAISFYLLGYLFSNLGAFLVIVIYFLAVKSDEVSSYSGLAQRSPLLACALFLALMSLAGIPPLAGFFGKFFLFIATIQAGWIWLALIGAINVIISLYYYLGIVKRMYMDPPLTLSPISVPLHLRLTLWLAIAGMIGIGVFQGPFVTAALAAVKGMF